MLLLSVLAACFGTITLDAASNTCASVWLDVEARTFAACADTVVDWSDLGSDIFGVCDGLRACTAPCESDADCAELALDAGLEGTAACGADGLCSVPGVRGVGCAR